jgi:hypothetical protein
VAKRPHPHQSGPGVSAPTPHARRPRSFLELLAAGSAPLRRLASLSTSPLLPPDPGFASPRRRPGTRPRHERRQAKPFFAWPRAAAASARLLPPEHVAASCSLALRPLARPPPPSRRRRPSSSSRKCRSARGSRMYFSSLLVRKLAPMDCSEG